MGQNRTDMEAIFRERDACGIGTIVNIDGRQEGRMPPARSATASGSFCRSRMISLRKPRRSAASPSGQRETTASACSSCRRIR